MEQNPLENSKSTPEKKKKSKSFFKKLGLFGAAALFSVNMNAETAKGGPLNGGPEKDKAKPDTEKVDQKAAKNFAKGGEVKDMGYGVKLAGYGEQVSGDDTPVRKHSTQESLALEGEHKQDTVKALNFLQSKARAGMTIQPEGYKSITDMTPVEFGKLTPQEIDLYFNEYVGQSGVQVMTEEERQEKIVNKNQQSQLIKTTAFDQKYEEVTKSEGKKEISQDRGFLEFSGDTPRAAIENARSSGLGERDTFNWVTPSGALQTILITDDPKLVEGTKPGLVDKYDDASGLTLTNNKSSTKIVEGMVQGAGNLGDQSKK